MIVFSAAVVGSSSGIQGSTRSSLLSLKDRFSYQVFSLTAHPIQYYNMTTLHVLHLPTPNYLLFNCSTSQPFYYVQS